MSEEKTTPVPPPPVAPDLTLLPATIRKAIEESDGDLVLASSKLGVAVSRLDRVIRLAPKLLKFAGELKRVDGYKAYARTSIERVEEDITRRSVLYRSEALDAIRAIAMMPISENSAQNQVKLAAAVRLYGETREAAAGDEIQHVLRVINEDYRTSAPRLKSVRETIREVTFEDRPAIEGTATAAD